MPYASTKMLNDSATMLGMAFWSARDVLIHPVTDQESATRAAHHCELMAQTIEKGDHGAMAAAFLRGLAHAITVTFD